MNKALEELREMYAGTALLGLLAGEHEAGNYHERMSAVETAERAFEFADALIDEGQKRRGLAREEEAKEAAELPLVVMDDMVSRFLSWQDPHRVSNPLTADEARHMLEHVLEGTGSSVVAAPAMVLVAESLRTQNIMRRTLHYIAQILHDNRDNQPELQRYRQMLVDYAEAAAEGRDPFTAGAAK
jgi:hypothetical protein